MRDRNSTNYSANPDDAPIAFIDSGIGGLPYLQWASDHIDRETFVYFADRANFPYGTKSPGEVFSAVSQAVKKLISEVNPKMIVIACNTASVVALAGLRAAFPDIPFVGTVPAIKPAAGLSRTKRIGVLATDRTVRDTYLDNLIERFAADCEVVRIGGPGIVDFVENRLFTSSSAERAAVIADAARHFRERGVDQVVLGCTHFLYVSEELRDQLGSGVELVDSREGVGHRMMELLDGRVGRGSGKGKSRMYLSGPREPEPRYKAFAERFGLELAGTL